MATPTLYQCNICSVTLTGEKSKLDHENGKKHIRLAQQKKYSSCGVFIKGYFDGMSKEEVLQYFSNFGAIHRTHVGPNMNYLILVYERSEDATKVITTQHHLNGRRVIVERKNSPLPEKDFSQREEQRHLNLLRVLKDLNYFHQQILRFLDNSTPNIEQALPLYQRVKEDIGIAMNRFFPGCYVFPFGSTTTDLQFNNSDIDIYVALKPDEKLDDIHFSIAKKALNQSSAFRNICPIPAAKIPIIKCVHNPTGIKCDVNFRNMLGVKNSELIHYFLSLDRKLRSIMLVIKYWAKINEITGINQRFSNYSLVMMFIFYLQRSYAFPSVLLLQHGTAPTDLEVLWNMNIYPKTDHFNMCQSRYVSALDIIKGFFNFYSKFPFDTEIICTYLGHSVNKSMFSRYSTIPREFVLYRNNFESLNSLKHDKPLCVQDPFEHNINVCSNIFQNVLEKFRKMCDFSFNILEKNGEKGILYKLFTEKPELAIEKPSLVNELQSHTICLKKGNNMKYIRKMINSKSSKDEELNDLWFTEVRKYLRTVFEDVLKLDLKNLNKGKFVKLDNQHDVHENEAFLASCFLNLWDARSIKGKPIEEDLNKCDNILDRDVLLSNYVWTKNSALKPDTPLFECEIHIRCQEDPVSVSIELVKICSYKKIFKSFAVFLTNKLDKWFDEYERDLNKLID